MFPSTEYLYIKRKISIIFNFFDNQTTQTSPAVMKRPREEDPCADPDHNLTIDQMLAKYANENSDNDSDFVPNLEEEDSSSNTSSDESSSESHSSDEISSGEREEMANQVRKL